MEEAEKALTESLAIRLPLATRNPSVHAEELERVRLNLALVKLHSRRRDPTRLMFWFSNFARLASPNSQTGPPLSRRPAHRSRSSLVRQSTPVRGTRHLESTCIFTVGRPSGGGEL